MGGADRPAGCCDGGDGRLPPASAVCVDGAKYFGPPRKLYFKNGDSADKFTGTATDYNAAYDPDTGTLTLKNYSGKEISAGGVNPADITVVLIGTNTINDGSIISDMGGDITITSDSGGTLTITNTTDVYPGAMIGIRAGYGGSFTTGNVTIKGNTKVTVSITHNGTRTYDRAYGIYAKENITICENASVDNTCATPNNTTTDGELCNGLRAVKYVIINTNGEVEIDVTNAGNDSTYSFGIYPSVNATLSNVGEMEVKWKKLASISRYSGGAVYKGASFSETDHAVNVDTTNCYASYRKGTPYTVRVENGNLTGPGVPYAKNNGNFLAGDTVNITPYERKSASGEVIPFQKWVSDDVALASPTTPNTSFNVPANAVTVTAKHNPFVGMPMFTRESEARGTIEFKTAVKPDDGTEYFQYVEVGKENDPYEYKRPYFEPSTTSAASPYQYIFSATNYNSGDIRHLEAGDYRMAVTLNGERYLSDPFTVNYTVPTANISLDKAGTVDFGNVEAGYTTAPAAQTVTITNSGTAATGALTIALEGSNAGSFTVSPNSITDIPAGGNATFTVRPKTGLTAGTYTATVKVSGTGTGVTAQSFDVKFTVYDPGASAAVDGTIKSYGSASETVTVTLIPASGTPLTTTVTGNNAAYSFPTVPAGEYTLKVEKTGHTPFSKVITVGSNHVTENVTIHLIGDVNGDEAITADDLTALARHVVKISVITDTAALARCDVTKDGSVTADDLTMLARYVAKIISSFD